MTEIAITVSASLIAGATLLVFALDADRELQRFVDSYGVAQAATAYSRSVNDYEALVATGLMPVATILNTPQASHTSVRSVNRVDRWCISYQGSKFAAALEVGQCDEDTDNNLSWSTDARRHVVAIEVQTHHAFSELAISNSDS